MASYLQPKLAQLRWAIRGRLGNDPTASPDPEMQRCAIDKCDLVTLLARRLGLKTYLEICTAVSGNYYRRIYESGLLETRRLMYRCRRYRADGLPIDYRSATDDITAPLAQLAREGFRPGICLVDSWHDYTTSLRDIAVAFALLPECGIIVVHDCLPPSLDMASPQPQGGCWCGWSYRAFIDFVWSTPGLVHFTVDCDFGCGVIVKTETGGDLERLPSGLLPQAATPAEVSKALAGWQALGDDPAAAFDYLHTNRQVLLNLVSAEDFMAAFDAGDANLQRSPVSPAGKRTDVELRELR